MFGAYCPVRNTNILPHCIRPCIYCLRQFCSLSIRMHPHLAEVTSQVWLELSMSRFRQFFAAAPYGFTRFEIGDYFGIMTSKFLCLKKFLLLALGFLVIALAFIHYLSPIFHICAMIDLNRSINNPIIAVQIPLSMEYGRAQLLLFHRCSNGFIMHRLIVYIKTLVIYKKSPIYQKIIQHHLLSMVQKYKPGGALPEPADDENILFLPTH